QFLLLPEQGHEISYLPSPLFLPASLNSPLLCFHTLNTYESHTSSFPFHQDNIICPFPPLCRLIIEISLLLYINFQTVPCHSENMLASGVFSNLFFLKGVSHSTARSIHFFSIATRLKSTFISKPDIHCEL